MAKRVPNFHGARVYNLTSGATLPSWISDQKKRELAKDPEFRRRIEIVQDLEFPTAAQRIEISPDGQFLVSTGTYRPAVRVFDLNDLSMKFERRLDCECEDFQILSEDYSKLVFLRVSSRMTCRQQRASPPSQPVVGRPLPRIPRGLRQAPHTASAALWAVHGIPHHLL